MRRLRVLVLAVAAASCGSDAAPASLGGSCEQTSDCEAGLECVSGACSHGGGGGGGERPPWGRADTATDTPSDALPPGCAPGERVCSGVDLYECSRSGGYSLVETCLAPKICHDGACCTPSCAGKPCGASNGCGGTCGKCEDTTAAKPDTAECVPSCAGKQCGSDGCDGTCGSCAPGQTCVGGQCSGPCTVPALFSEVCQKVVEAEFSLTGHPGDSLDLDNDPATCAPAGSCSGGIDNSMGGAFAQVAPFLDVNGQVAEGIAAGKAVLLLDMPGFSLAGEIFVINGYTGSLAPSNPACDPLAAGCQYVVDPGSFGSDCKPLVVFEDGEVQGQSIKAGGPDSVFVLPLALSDTATIAAPILGARVEGKITTDGQGLYSIDGILGGGLPKQKLIEALYLIPEEDLPVTRDTMEAIIEAFVVEDLDFDGDGVPDAASVGIRVKSLRVTIEGLEAE